MFYFGPRLSPQQWDLQREGDLDVWLHFWGALIWTVIDKQSILLTLEQNDVSPVHGSNNSVSNHDI